MQLRNFAQAVAAENFAVALAALGNAAAALATSVSGCGVPQVTARLDALAGAITWAKVNMTGFDHSVQIIIGAADLTLDVKALGQAITAENANQVGNALGQLINDWTHITGGCGASDKACHFLDGILRVLQVAIPDASACRAALAPAWRNRVHLHEFLSDLYGTFTGRQLTEAASRGRALRCDSGRRAAVSPRHVQTADSLFFA